MCVLKQSVWLIYCYCEKFLKSQRSSDLVSSVAALFRGVRERGKFWNRSARETSQAVGRLFRVRSEAEVSLWGLVSLPRVLEPCQARRPRNRPNKNLRELVQLDARIVRSEMHWEIISVDTLVRVICRFANKRSSYWNKVTVAEAKNIPL